MTKLTAHSSPFIAIGAAATGPERSSVSLTNAKMSLRKDGWTRGRAFIGAFVRM
jgi:hypothetical protein